MRHARERRRQPRLGGREREMTRVCAEFREMPGLRITVPQAARLFSLEHRDCARLLEALVDRGVLFSDGQMFQMQASGAEMSEESILRTFRLSSPSGRRL